jgi:hypothetical protein
MARYKHSTHLGTADDKVFDRLIRPGTEVPADGIYRCDLCGSELALTRGSRIPSDHHRDEHPSRRAGWRLIVSADNDESPI